MTTADFTVETGDRVAYSVAFLRSTGLVHTDYAHARGCVVEVKQFGDDTQLATIDWDRDMPSRVNVANLAKVGPNLRFCAA